MVHSGALLAWDAEGSGVCNQRLLLGICLVVKASTSAACLAIGAEEGDLLAACSDAATLSSCCSRGGGLAQAEQAAQQRGWPTSPRMRDLQAAS